MPELMKGHSYKDRGYTVRFPCIAEVKYDEVRLHVRFIPHHIQPAEDRVEFLTYSGKTAFNMESFAPLFLQFFQAAPPDMHELDMGVEVNGNFGDSVRWVKSSKGVPQYKLDKKTGTEHPALDASMVRFYLFDLPCSSLVYMHDLPALSRFDLRNAAASALQHCALSVHIPQNFWCAAPDQLDGHFQNTRALGHEGLMVKSLEHTYQRGKRIDGWLKMKPAEEGDGVIGCFIQAVSEDGTPLGRAGSMVLHLEDGSTATPHGIPHALGKDMWENPHLYIGQWWTFNYMERDRQGGYRHPTVGRRREEKV